MSAPSLSSIVAIGVDILNASRDETTGTVLCQTGDVVSGQVESDRVELWQQVGVYSIPSNPVPGESAAQGVVWKRGDLDVCTNTRDTRAQAIYGLIKAGETCIAAAGADGTGQACTLYKQDGSVTNFTTAGNVPGAESVYARVGPGVDADTGAPDGHAWVGPWGTVKFDATGFHIVHKPSGAEFHLGGVGGMPSPLDVITSYCNIVAGTFHANVSSAAVGTGTVQLASATAVLAAISGLQAQLTALATAVDLQPKGTLAAVPFAAAAISSGAATVAATTAITTTTASADL